MRVWLSVVLLCSLATACAGPAGGSGGGAGGGAAGGAGGGSTDGGDGGTADGGADAGCLRGDRIALLSSVVAYDLEELASGYLIAASQRLDDGGFDAVAVLLDSKLQPLGTVRLPNGAASTAQNIRATSYRSNAYVVFSERVDDAGVHLVEVASDGGVTELALITDSRSRGPATIGANEYNLLVAFVASSNADGLPSEAALYTFPRDGGVMSKRDVNGVPDGGLDPSVDVQTAKVSPHGLAFVWTGYDNDGGLAASQSIQLLGGTNVGAPLLDDSYVLEDTGPAVRVAWTENVNFSFFGIVENYSQASYGHDLYSAARGVVARAFDDSTVLEHTNIGRGVVGPALVWTEYDSQLTVTTAPNQGATPPVNFFTFDPDAGTHAAGFPDVAFCGIGDSLAVTYLDSAIDAGTLYGQLTCSP